MMNDILRREIEAFGAVAAQQIFGGRPKKSQIKADSLDLRRCDWCLRYCRDSLYPSLSFGDLCKGCVRALLG